MGSRLIDVQSLSVVRSLTAKCGGIDWGYRDFWQMRKRYISQCFYLSFESHPNQHVLLVEANESMQGSMNVAESEMYQQWIWGYVSAASFRYGLPPGSDGPGVTQWVAHWCESHGDDLIVSAAGAYIARYETVKISGGSPAKLESRSCL
jgi:hypothetical protein